MSVIGNTIYNNIRTIQAAQIKKIESDPTAYNNLARMAVITDICKGKLSTSDLNDIYNNGLSYDKDFKDRLKGYIDQYKTSKLSPKLIAAKSIQGRIDSVSERSFIPVRAPIADANWPYTFSKPIFKLVEQYFSPGSGGLITDTVKEVSSYFFAEDKKNYIGLSELLNTTSHQFPAFKQFLITEGYLPQDNLESQQAFISVLSINETANQEILSLLSGTKTRLYNQSEQIAVLKKFSEIVATRLAKEGLTSSKPLAISQQNLKNVNESLLKSWGLNPSQLLSAAQTEKLLKFLENQNEAQKKQELLKAHKEKIQSIQNLSDELFYLAGSCFGNSPVLKSFKITSDIAIITADITFQVVQSLVAGPIGWMQLGSSVLSSVNKLGRLLSKAPSEMALIQSEIRQLQQVIKAGFNQVLGHLTHLHENQEIIKKICTEILDRMIQSTAITHAALEEIKMNVKLSRKITLDLARHQELQKFDSSVSKLSMLISQRDNEPQFRSDFAIQLLDLYNYTLSTTTSPIFNNSTSHQLNKIEILEKLNSTKKITDNLGLLQQLARKIDPVDNLPNLYLMWISTLLYVHYFKLSPVKSHYFHTLTESLEGEWHSAKDTIEKISSRTFIEKAAKVALSSTEQLSEHASQSTYSEPYAQAWFKELNILIGCELKTETLLQGFTNDFTNIQLPENISKKNQTKVGGIKVSDQDLVNGIQRHLENLGDGVYFLDETKTHILLKKYTQLDFKLASKIQSNIEISPSCIFNLKKIPNKEVYFLNPVGADHLKNPCQGVQIASAMFVHQWNNYIGAFKKEHSEEIGNKLAGRPELFESLISPINELCYDLTAFNFFVNINIWCQLQNDPEVNIIDQSKLMLAISQQISISLAELKTGSLLSSIKTAIKTRIQSFLEQYIASQLNLIEETKTHLSFVEDTLVTLGQILNEKQIDTHVKKALTQSNQSLTTVAAPSNKTSLASRITNLALLTGIAASIGFSLLRYKPK